MVVNDKFAQFKELLKYPMMESDESKFMLAQMFTDSMLGANGVTANNGIKSTPIIDISFRHPLMVYDFIFKFAMDDIIKNVPTSKNLDDFSKNVKLHTKVVIHSILSAIIDFFNYPNDMVPNADYSALNRGFNKMRLVAESAIISFAPDSGVKTRGMLRYEPLPRDMFVGSDRMMWFLCFSDISWTIDLINSTKGAAIRNMQTTPLHAIISMVEPPTLNFFNLYISGIKSIALNEKPAYNQLGILYMIFYIDSICYYDWNKYHTETGLFDSSMTAQVDVITDNAVMMFDKINSLIAAQGMCVITLPDCSCKM